ncbi:hypothetical protein TWF694_011463 [Orbilia ellipsospora]|uniref:Uncharacterized protein n=1 Tax=Orbilia ellipsospora TaxID=2528407 RepID=A0AAV9X5J9_9PEZI
MCRKYFSNGHARSTGEHKGLTIWLITNPHTLPVLPAPIQGLPWFQVRIGPGLYMEDESGERALGQIENTTFDCSSGIIRFDKAYERETWWETWSKKPLGNPRSHTGHLFNNVTQRIIFNRYRNDTTKCSLVYKSNNLDLALVKLGDPKKFDCTIRNIAVTGIADNIESTVPALARPVRNRSTLGYKRDAKIGFTIGT